MHVPDCGQIEWVGLYSLSGVVSMYEKKVNGN